MDWWPLWSPQLPHLCHLLAALLLVSVSELLQEPSCQRAHGPVQRAAGLPPLLPQPQASEACQGAEFPLLLPPIRQLLAVPELLLHLLPQPLRPACLSSAQEAGWHRSLLQAINES